MRIASGLARDAGIITLFCLQTFAYIELHAREGIRGGLEAHRAVVRRRAGRTANTRGSE
jgi:hypothetical protein